MRPEKSKNIIRVLKSISVFLPLTTFTFNSHALDFNEVSDNSTIIGKVFNDLNHNGVQDENEYGIPGVRLATATGLMLETDGYGRYHIPDNAINNRYSNNLILKIDKASLPMGSIIQSKNPRVIRLSSASVNRINFAIKY